MRTLTPEHPYGSICCARAEALANVKCSLHSLRVVLREPPPRYPYRTLHPTRKAERRGRKQMHAGGPEDME
jgi:hypothetical protein